MTGSATDGRGTAPRARLDWWSPPTLQETRAYFRARVLAPAARGLEQARRMRRARRGPPQPAVPRRPLFPVPGEPFGGWTYHDERWTRIVDRFEHRRLLRQGRALVVDDDRQQSPADVACRADGSVVADVPADGRERWVWLHLEPDRNLWRNFRWEFTARRDSDFRELQFAFRYRDFYNRYRFRHEADALHFDIVENGRFRNDIHRQPFRMELGRDYRYAIEVRDDRFLLAVDDALILDEVDSRQLFPRGSIAIVLWEKGGRTPIRASVADIRVAEI